MVALGEPFQLYPSFSGTSSSSLSHSSTVGARFHGLVSHGILRTPRTLNSESCGTRQYMSAAGRSGASTLAGERRCVGGRYPVVHGGGRLMFRLKSNWAPRYSCLVLELGTTIAAMAAIPCGNSTSSCSM